MRAMFALVTSVALMACAIDDDPSLSDTADEILAANILAANKLAANILAANKLAANQLAASKLSSTDIMETADGRYVLSFVIGCALPSGTTITATSRDGMSYQFTGLLGLAASWATAAPTVAQRRWVTACVMSRTNLYGVPVNISMRHDTNALLSTSATERTSYSLVEGAFYGDLFAPQPVLYACGVKPWTSAAPGSFRACARSQNGATTDCGFTYTGNCATGPACSDKSAPFAGCLGGATSYAEVITINLRP